MQPVGPRTDPAPSRWSYRMQRVMLHPFYRRLIKVGLPMAVALALIVSFFADPTNRAAIGQAYENTRQKIINRPEFMVQALEIDGASAELDKIIRARFPYDLPISSFDIELDALRLAIETIPAVADASLRVQKGGALTVAVKEREPVVLWRTHDALNVVDHEGVSIATLPVRTDAPQLPLIAGHGAADHVDEALAIFAASTPLKDRVRGLVRMGERRWDLVLDREQRIMLPETQPVMAVERVIALAQAQDLLDRDVVVVDMRMNDRPTVRMNARAIDGWRETANILN